MLYFPWETVQITQGLREGEIWSGKRGTVGLEGQCWLSQWEQGQVLAWSWCFLPTTQPLLLLTGVRVECALGLYLISALEKDVK